ncbi:amidoligase family protein [Zooshikella marina]|uniref:amidoligase family protein n=1 Tax=Zooshikella ganghwensis TaxID=202772 RepID=UPI001BAF6394|nr:amidoligase family protein [Zooshikella ganghwensis]MBU2708997.1 amidoligase family protein [Zooshikella ganghwensis]
MSNEINYCIPAETNNLEGKPRRVGFELEFADLSLQQVTDILCEKLNGKVHSNNPAETIVIVEGLGKFTIELDWQFAKETAKERARQHALEYGDKKVDDHFMIWLTKLASIVVPIEIVCPPIEIKDLTVLDGMVSALRSAGAKGTGESLWYAFGVHINPEVTDNDPEKVMRTLKSYAICQDWLLKTHQVDPIRRVTPYIDLFPKSYINTLITYKSNISWTKLIEDYLEYNPTRNRALDALPLFKYIDQNLIDQRLDDPRIKARPTFHYRMPNCEIEKNNWFLYKSWNVWCVIEHIAQNEQLLEQLVIEWQRYNQALINIKPAPWFNILDEIYQNLS